MSYWDQRRHREGGDGRSERFESARQRTVILTFATTDEADAWDEAGQPLSVAAVADVTEVTR